jgi:Predicted acetyltransferase
MAGEEHGIEADKASLESDDFFLFAGYVGSEPVATVSFHVSEYDCTRFDYVFTAPKHRGRGYARELLSYVTDFCREKNFQNCFQWPANETSEEICYQAGFRTAFEFEGATAFAQFA